MAILSSCDPCLMPAHGIREPFDQLAAADYASGFDYRRADPNSHDPNPPDAFEGHWFESRVWPRERDKEIPGAIQRFMTTVRWTRSREGYQNRTSCGWLWVVGSHRSLWGAETPIGS